MSDTLHAAQVEELATALERYGIHGEEVFAVLCATIGCGSAQARLLGVMRDHAGPPCTAALYARLDECQKRSFRAAVSALMAPADGLLAEDQASIDVWQRVRHEAVCAIAALIAGDVLSATERAGLLGPWEKVFGFSTNGL